MPTPIFTNFKFNVLTTQRNFLSQPIIFTSILEETLGSYSQHFITFAQLARVFVPDNLFQPSVMFVGKASILHYLD